MISSTITSFPNLGRAYATKMSHKVSNAACATLFKSIDSDSKSIAEGHSLYVIPDAVDAVKLSRASNPTKPVELDRAT